ncbi:MAG: dual specificity protein phosphatase family protein [Desulfobacterales bacterium]|jgi:hypothetical protein|nr:dual specificity protein phosphatase family protein [Desulfobacterales bacterium]
MNAETIVAPIPFPRSYWVIPGKLLAGAFPGAKDPAEASYKLAALIDAGIRNVVNLMEPDETDYSGHRFAPYADAMGHIAAGKGESVTFDRMPIRDLSVPAESQMTAILDRIDRCIENGRPVYVHCWGGIGRTGTVVGCHLARHGLAAGEDVLKMIKDLRRDAGDAARESPETKAQRDMVTLWRRGS